MENKEEKGQQSSPLLPTALQRAAVQPYFTPRIPTALPSVKYSYDVSVRNNSTEKESKNYREGEKVMFSAKI